MKFSAIFESWHVEDGNYPPLSKGQLVNLSFQCEPRRLERAAEGSFPWIDHRDNAECQFCARVLQVHSGSDAIAVLDTGTLRFYVNGSEITSFPPGSLVRGEGTMLLDHYLWVEFVDKRPDPPDLFYNLRVSRIRRVQIPGRFVARYDRGKHYPTRVSPSEFEPEHVVELETMVGQPFDEEFYILEFDDTGLDGERVARTFRTFQ